MYTNDKLKVLIFHGSTTKTRLLKAEELSRYDVIIISCMSLNHFSYTLSMVILICLD